MIPQLKHPIPRDIAFKAWMLSMPLVTLDFETYYDDDYSLRKMTMTEYVQHPKFKAQSVSVRIDKVEANKLVRGDVEYFKDVASAMDRLRELDKWVMIGQNTKFDGYICHYHYDVHPTVYADTKAMSKGLWPFEQANLAAIAKRLWPNDPTMRKGEELAQSKGILDWSDELHAIIEVYCKKDSFLTAEAFWQMFNQYPDEELEIIHITNRMFCHPVLTANHAVLDDAAKDELDERERVAQKALDMANELVALKGLEYWNPDAKEAKKKKPLDTMLFSSRNRYIAFLREICDLELPMKKKQRKDGSEYETEATAKNDPEYLDLVADNPDLDLIFEAREIFASSQALSRARRMKDISKAEKGFEIPVALGYYNAHTGRYGGEEKTNMQNLGRGSKHRLALEAPDNFMVHVADSSNVEARTNAGFCGQEDLLEAFRRGEDVYSMFASEVYERKITKKTDPNERNVGKVCVLGLGYGMGPPTLRRTFASGPMGMPPIKFPLEMCQKMVNTYRSNNYMIADGWKQAGRVIENMICLAEGEFIDWGPIRVTKERLLLPNGMYLNYPKLQYNEKLKSFAYWNGMYWKRIYGGALIENIIQALARIIVMGQCVKIDRLLQQFGGWIVMQVHDENIGVASDMGKDDNDKLFEEINDLMRIPPAWMPSLPLDSEGGWAKNYSK